MAPATNPDSSAAADIAAALAERYGGVRTDRFKRQSRDGAAYPIVRAPLADAVLRAHVAGEETSAAFFVDDAGTTAIGEFDVDATDKDRPASAAVAEVARQLKRVLDAAGIPYLVTSSGRRGFHVTLFLEDGARLPVATMGAALGAILAQITLAEGVAVEIFPKAASARQGDTKLPCGIHRATGAWAAPVDDMLRPLPMERWAEALRAVDGTDPAALVALAGDAPESSPSPDTPTQLLSEEQFAIVLDHCPRLGEILADAGRPYETWQAALRAAACFDGAPPRDWAEEVTAKYRDASDTTRRRDRRTIERIFANPPLAPTCRALGCPGAGRRCGFARKGGAEPTPLRHLAKRETRRRIRVEPVSHPPVPREGRRVDAVRAEMAAQMRAFFGDAANDGCVLPVIVPPGTGKTTLLREGVLAGGGRLDIVTPRHGPFAEDAAAWARWGVRHLHGRNERNCRSLDAYRQARARGKPYCPDACPHRAACLASDGGYLGQFVGMGALAGTIAPLPHWHEGKVPDSRAVAFDDVAVTDLIGRVSLSRAQLATLAADAALTGADRRCARLLRDALGAGVPDAAVLDHLAGVAARHGRQLGEVIRRVSARSDELHEMAAAIRRHERARVDCPDAVSPIAITAAAIVARLPPRWPAAMRGQRIAMLGASLDTDLLRAVLPADLALAEPLTAAVAWDPNVRVIQYADRWLGATEARAMLDDGDTEPIARESAPLDAIVAAILRHADALGVAQRDIGVITFKALEAELARRVGTAHTAHYGAVASTNALENAPLLAVVGTYQPPLDDVRRQAAALWPDLTPGEVEMIERFLPFPGTDLSARTVCFRGERPQLLLRSRREEELYQAVHRLRPHLPDVAPRQIVIFASLPIPRIPAEVRFLDDETNDRLAHVRAGAAALRSLGSGGRMPAKADVLRRMNEEGHALNRGALDRLWGDVLHAAGDGVAGGGADARGSIRREIPPRATAPPAVRGLAAANDRREEQAYAAALGAIAALRREGIAVTPAAVARRLGIKKPNRGVKRAVTERRDCADRSA